MPFVPTISPDILALRPDFTVLSIFAENIRNSESDAWSTGLLDEACTAVDAAPWAEEHLDAWRDAYRAFGAKPQRTPCSAEALRRRVQRDGRLPAVNAVVDLYNAISVRHAIPVGGEDAGVYAGSPSLIRAVGGEPFETVQDGQPKIEPVDPGEVVWRDALGVTCRRWNWRQGTRTRIGPETASMWFVLERLDPMPIEALERAGDELIEGLGRLSPDIRTSTLLLSAP
jgi:DNA/RNA-binding domain of Phe-tRNA-synthetase-like protein